MWTTLRLIVIFSLMKGTSLKIRQRCKTDFPENENNELSYSVDPNFVYFIWNKTSRTAIEYVQDYCGSRCYNGVNINQNIGGESVLCLECECRKPACEIYDICCEDSPDSKTVSNSSSSSSTSPKLGCDSNSIQGFDFLYIRSCLENYHDNDEVKRLCLEDVGVNDTTVETFVRVLDSDTQVVYYNTYCAMCNQVQKPVQLTLNATCTSYMLVYMAENINDLIRLMLTDSEHCFVYQKFKDNVSHFECYNGQYSGNQVNQCDRKNTNKMFDPDIVEACDQLAGYKYQVYSQYTEKYYKNIFCSICDLMSYPFLPNSASCWEDDVDDVRRLYQMLISFKDETLDEEKSFSINTCNETSWTSSNGHCLQLKCSPGKKLSNGTCTSIFNQITGLGYRVRSLLVFDSWDEHRDNLTDLLDIAEQQLYKGLEDISDGFSFQLGVVKNYYHNVSKNVAPILWANIFILASKLINRDSFEENAFNVFFNDSLNKTQFYFYRILTEDMYTHCCGESKTRWPVRYKAVENSKLTIPISLGSEHSIPLTLTLTCSFITFKQFTINFNKSHPGQGVTVTLDLDGTSVTISNISDINTIEVTTGDELNVCREILDRYKDLDTYYKKGYFSLMYMTQIVLTYICMGASELCLLMTLVIYLCLSELRTAPGINNMFLSLSLLLAQLVLVAASNSSGPSDFCTFIGIATHFLWLWQFSWSFLCSFHMFQVFTSKIPTHPTKNTDIYIHVMKLLSFSLSVPSVIVSSVIIASYLTSQTFGYGRHSCYLDSALLIGVSMIGPICLVSLCNLTFLVVTVSSIHRVNSLLTFDSMRADQFKNLTLYIKLSTVTGAYWIVTIVAEALDNDILRLVSIVLNGLQGVTIFVSYTFKKRVYQLVSTRTSSSRSTLATSTS